MTDISDSEKCKNENKNSRYSSVIQDICCFCMLEQMLTDSFYFPVPSLHEPSKKVQRG